MHNNKLIIKHFDFSNVNPPIVMIGKRNTGKSWLIKKRIDLILNSN